MIKKIFSNVTVNFIYYYKSRIFSALALFLFIWAVYTGLSDLHGATENSAFSAVCSMHNRNTGMISFLCAVICAFSITHFIKDKSIRMILTRPCPPEYWILSHFVSALIMYTVLSVFNTTLCYTILGFFGIIFQYDLIYSFFDKLFNQSVYICFVIMLSVFSSPLSAIIASMLLNGSRIFTGIATVSVYLESSLYSLWLQASHHALALLYFLIPVDRPDELDGISFLVKILYCTVCCSFFYLCSSVYFRKQIRKKSLL